MPEVAKKKVFAHLEDRKSHTDYEALSDRMDNSAVDCKQHYHTQCENCNSIHCHIDESWQDREVEYCHTCGEKTAFNPHEPFWAKSEN